MRCAAQSRFEGTVLLFATCYPYTPDFTRGTVCSFAALSQVRRLDLSNANYKPVGAAPNVHKRLDRHDVPV